MYTIHRYTHCNLSVDTSTGTLTEFETEIQSCLKKWINILKLDHWDIEFKVDPHKCNFEENEECMACVEDDSSIRYAIIYVNSKEFFDNNPKQPLEQVLIHELLHIKFSLLHPEDYSSLEFKVLHQIIDDLSKSFIQCASDTKK